VKKRKKRIFGELKRRGRSKRGNKTKENHGFFGEEDKKTFWCGV